MLFLVNDILDFSQIEAKSLILNYSNVNLVEVIQECINVLKFKADEKGIVLKIRLEDEDPSQYWPPTLCTDENRFKQVLINLISNALKYTRHGHVIIYNDIDIDNR
jgi:signal transduction histidine kinase